MAERATDGGYVALLRGINVGGRNKLPMAELVAMFEEAGCEDVRTYIQSGNVVFRASEDLAKRLPAIVSQAIAERHGLDVPVVVRSAEELEKAAAENPFPREGAEERALHVMFMDDEPAPDAVASLDPDRSPGDTFVVRGREIYLHCPNGVGRTKLTNDYFDRRLGTTSTSRNWRTVNRLIEMSGGRHFDGIK